MKTIKVVAAIIKKDSQVFATQRGYGDFAGGWEFPGGKIETGESPNEALIREIKEELDSEIKVNELFYVVEYDYPQFHLSMNCYICELLHGTLTLVEHSAGKWLSKEELYTVDWLPADKGIIAKLEKYL